MKIVNMKEENTAMNNVWRVYNQALLPTMPPHVEPDISEIKEKGFWRERERERVFLVRWVSDWDCQEQTNWWYVIKDTPFDIGALKSKRRYEINKGNKNFSVKEIDPRMYKKEIYKIQKQAYMAYPEKYRPQVHQEKLFKEIDAWPFYKVYGAFHAETGEMVGYAALNRKEDYIYYAVHKTVPAMETLGINASIVHKILVEHESFLISGGYISDGSRNILHETGFQNYLEKYFGFRKAYCKLHIVYRPSVLIAVRMLYPFRKLLYAMDKISMIHKINGVLKMEEAVRS